MYNKTPSEIIGIKDEYEAFCVNEACTYIRIKIEEDNEDPIFKAHDENKIKYSNFSDYFDNVTRV